MGWENLGSTNRQESRFAQTKSACKVSYMDVANESSPVTYFDCYYSQYAGVVQW